MLIFRLKKKWWDKVISGEKTHEYREVGNTGVSDYSTKAKNILEKVAFLVYLRWVIRNKMIKAVSGMQKLNK